jgi:hypothetical protein
MYSYYTALQHRAHWEAVSDKGAPLFRAGAVLNIAYMRKLPVEELFHISISDMGNKKWRSSSDNLYCIAA